jgi:DNA-binding protein HU-beta
MTKTEFVEQLRDRVGGTKADARRYYDAFISLLKTNVISGDPLTIVNFGRFSVSKRAPRVMRNPQTKQPVQVGERKVLRFKPANTLKKEVNATV